jgi:hypothetical protein
LDLDDPSWTSLIGGYGVPYDPSPHLRTLDAGTIDDAEWSEMVTNLYHQGDVGGATYATIPHLTRIYAIRRRRPVDTYQFVAMVELARRNGRNPPVPSFCLAAYENAFSAMALFGLEDLPSAKDSALISCIIALVALEKGQHMLAKFACLFDEGERASILKSAKWLS